MESQSNSSILVYSSQNRQTPKNDTNEPLEEETSQLWMIRRLKTLLFSSPGEQSDGINEQFISDFILHQDITVLRNFLMASGLRRVLFLCIYRVTVPSFDSLSETIAATLQLTESKPRQIQKMSKISLKAELSQPSNLSQTTESKPKAEATKTSPKKIKKSEKTKKNVRKNKKSGKSADQGNGDEADAISIQINDEDTNYADLYADLSAPEIAETSDVQETDGRETKSEKDSEEEATQKSMMFGIVSQELVQEEFAALQQNTQMETKVTLKWHSKQCLPFDIDYVEAGESGEEQCQEFVYILTRDSLKTDEKSEFDRIYHMDYCTDMGPIRNVLRTGKTLLGAEVPFQMQIDMLVNLQTPSGTMRTVYWQNPEFRFENLILDSVVKAEKGRSLNVLGASSSGQQFVAALVEQENSAEFIDNLLRPRIYAYVTNPSNLRITTLSQ
ncbi:hypothetical protein DdX_02773 [Ditylenchus destructor]|uniref:Uncharacterized protein n=1 Tax=Ditylenchus destructor TaxID=166010 RepID=A0AAD4RC85_9BILA|nr:hypothetical protein DdX_02773 [Ditylenchus destructor]